MNADYTFEEFIKKVFENINVVIHLKNDEKRSHLNNCLKFNKDISIHLRKQKLKYLANISDYFEFINKHYVILKTEIDSFLTNISHTISVNKDIFNDYITYFTDLELIIQCISLIFTELINEVISNDYSNNDEPLHVVNMKPPIYEYMYRKWFSIVYCRFNFQFNYIINDFINNLRNYLTTNLSISNLKDILAQDSTIEPDYSELIDLDMVKIIDSVEKFINTLKTLDHFIDNKETIESFKNNYINCSRNLYLYFNNSIVTIKNNKDKINEAIKILLIESFINNRFMYDTDLLGKNLIDKLFTNSNYLVEYIDNVFEKYKSLKLSDGFVDDIIYLYSKIDLNLNKMEDFMNYFLDHKYISIILVKLLEFKPEKYVKICNHILDKTIEHISLLFTQNLTIANAIKTFLSMSIVTNLIILEISNFNSKSKDIDLIDKFKVLNPQIKTILNNNIYEIIETVCTDNKLNVDFSLIVKFIPELFNIFEDLDEQELIFKKIVCKKLLFENINSILNFTRLETLSYNINNFDLKSPLKIVKSLQDSESLSREIEFTQNLSENSINLKVFPDGITPIKAEEIKLEKYKSDLFKQYVLKTKSIIRQGYLNKYNQMPRKLSYNDLLSSVEVVLMIDNKSITCICRLSQADILFYLQNEYETKYSQLRDSDINTDTKEMINDELNSDNKFITNFRFIDVLLKKKILVQKNKLIQINSKLKIKENKIYNFTKLKADQFINPNQKRIDEEERIRKITSKVHNNLLFSQQDYMKAFIIRYCKSKKETTCMIDDIHIFVESQTKNRFKFKKDQLLEQLNKLVEDDFIEYVADNQYKYIL